MYFQDSMYGKIKLDRVELKLLKTDTMKSLSGKIDIGNINLVYPNAKHTRLEHSLGVMHTADRICCTLSEKGFEVDGERSIIRLAALLHDVGHGSRVF
ncbi:MAG: HD domain-containing protein [Candidatus Jordarchaeaceae archaeon]